MQSVRPEEVLISVNSLMFEVPVLEFWILFYRYLTIYLYMQIDNKLAL